jgi:hypothetical protein
MQSAGTELACPSPYCDSIFSNDNDVCLHLGDPTTDCAAFAQSYLDAMLQRQSAAGYGSDDESGELSDMTKFLTSY